MVEWCGCATKSRKSEGRLDSVHMPDAATHQRRPRHHLARPVTGLEAGEHLEAGHVCMAEVEVRSSHQLSKLRGELAAREARLHDVM